MNLRSPPFFSNAGILFRPFVFIFNRQIVETEAKSITQDQYTWYMAARFLGIFDTTKTNIHGRSLSWLHKGTSVKGGYIELMAISY
jgi:hypothetical protein